MTPLQIETPNKNILYGYGMLPDEEHSIGFNECLTKPGFFNVTFKTISGKTGILLYQDQNLDNPVIVRIKTVI